MSETTGDALFYGLMLLLPLSALLARRLPLKSTAKMGLAWAAIFAVGVLIVNQRDRFQPLLNGVKDAFSDHDQTARGATMRIRMADDGHFWAMVTVNGVQRRMLVDSGATTTALSMATAQAANIDLDESPFPTIIDTANGKISARVSSARAFAVGSITANGLPIVVSPAFGETDVIGMNFLSRLKSWRVEGQTLVLEPTAN